MPLRSRRSPPLSPVLVAAAASALAAACGHTIHPAAVQPGLTLDVLPAHEITRHEPRRPSDHVDIPADFAPFTSSRPSLQVALGYGWRLTEQTGLQLQLAGGTLTLPTLAAYAQFLAVPFDAGAGLALAFPGYLGPYVMAGKAFGDGPTRFRIDGGLRGMWVLEPYRGDYPAAGPMALLSLQRPSWAAGLWSDTVFVTKPEYFEYCDEVCDTRDVGRWRVSVGLYLQVRVFDIL